MVGIVQGAEPVGEFSGPLGGGLSEGCGSVQQLTEADDAQGRRVGSDGWQRQLATPRLVLTGGASCLAGQARAEGPAGLTGQQDGYHAEASRQASRSTHRRRSSTAVHRAMPPAASAREGLSGCCRAAIVHSYSGFCRPCAGRARCGLLLPVLVATAGPAIRLGPSLQQVSPSATARKTDLTVVVHVATAAIGDDRGWTAVVVHRAHGDCAHAASSQAGCCEGHHNGALDLGH